jgi:hypothetical protein
MAAFQNDYTQYIAQMTGIGNKGQERSQELYDWAKQNGVDLKSLADQVSGKAGAAADSQQGASDRLMQDWEGTYKPLYQGQAADASRMMSDLPGYEEHVAGKQMADTAQAIDLAKATQMRNMRSQGFSPSKVATGAIDTMAGTQRAAALASAGEGGRYAARSEARDVTGKALTQGQDVFNAGVTQGGMATANRNQQVNAPLSAASTSAGLYAPSTNMYSASEPFLQQWGDTMKHQDAMNLANEKQNAENSDGGIMSTLLPLAGGIAGSYFGPMGSAMGSSMGKSMSGAMGKAHGGRINVARGRRFASGGAIDTSAPMDAAGSDGRMIPPEASPSGGAAVDDVPAMVSEGEFVIPKRTVDWLGDKFFQKLIAKTDMEIEKDTTAAPDEGQPADDMPQGAIDMQPPMFRSEGART